METPSSSLCSSFTSLRTASIGHRHGLTSTPRLVPLPCFLFGCVNACVRGSEVVAAIVSSDSVASRFSSAVVSSDPLFRCCGVTEAEHGLQLPCLSVGGCSVCPKLLVMTSVGSGSNSLTGYATSII
jgi:hypothetical protein